MIRLKSLSISNKVIEKRFYRLVQNHKLFVTISGELMLIISVMLLITLGKNSDLLLKIICIGNKLFFKFLIRLH